MAHNYYDRTLAFAGICQAIKLVQQVAREGHCDSELMEQTLRTITVINADRTLDIFAGDEANLKVGLNAMVDGLDGSPTGNELSRYLISLMELQRKLTSRRDAWTQLGDRLATIDRQLEHFELTSDTIVQNLASIYLDVISPLGPRIQVTGSPDVLKHQDVQGKVRALLLAGIRAAVLYHQVGGRRRHVLLGRNKMVEQAKIMLARLG
uniref:high frequency lysogenization protein HflD n=1 Tax=Thaumasiovibrio occultus TaxID=1891184 RepID=UPI000B35C2FC|nr:high frequency lysogenization protein HflD [Thaumasiovibrio occultus]